MTRECKQQFTLRISQANSTELIVILYEMTLTYIEEARLALRAEDKNTFQEAVRKTRACFSELLNSLHPEYEPAPALWQLYLFCIRRLGSAQAGMKEEPLEEIAKMISPLRDAYAELAKQNSRGPVMNNSQTVYAGLTYGRNTLTENMADQGTNRGMLV